MELTKEERISRHKRFLASNWTLLAAFAWERYQRDGRGFVVIPETDFIEEDAPKKKKVRFDYLTKDNPFLKEVASCFGQKEWDWLDSYDPDSKVIAIVLRNEGGTSSYLFGGVTKPSEAYAR